MCRVIELDPESRMAHNNRGVAYLCTGDSASAVRDTSRAIELDPGYRDAYLNRGLAYSEIGELNPCIELGPYAWSGYRHRGIVLHMMGQGHASYRDYLRARELQEEA